MVKLKTEFRTLEPATRAEWRAWLQAHHATVPGVWLILAKKNSALPGVRYEEAVEEALCFGWIDSKTMALDEHRVKQTFTPRKAGGTWARSNKERVERLLAEGLMAPAGIAVIERAQADGSWNALDEIEDLAVPDDLAAAWAGNDIAQANFAAFPPTARRAYLWWIRTAKRPETRRKRIAETVRLVEQNVKNPQPMTRAD
jgi:uncharacterized protein YdeI (YjbR/CyaY-like superfamily)